MQAICDVMLALQKATSGDDELVVTMRGLATKPFEINGQDYVGLIDLVRQKIRLGALNWSMEHVTPSELFDELQAWLSDQGSLAKMARPDFKPNLVYDKILTQDFAKKVWSRA